MSGFAIAPKSNCPHVHNLDYAFVCDADAAIVNAACSQCQSTEENWLCLHCLEVFCSRYVNGHMKEHYEQNPGHCIAYSMTGSSIWCYECDSYIDHRKLRPVFIHLCEVRFGVDSDPAAATRAWAASAPVGHNPGNSVDSASEVPIDVHGLRQQQASGTISSNHHDEEGFFTETGAVASASDLLARPPAPDSSDDDESHIDQLANQVSKVSLAASSSSPLSPELALPQLTVEEFGKAMAAGKFKNVIVMAGAGISVSAGIPDFRTPGTGLYSNLAKYNLPRPEDVFTLDFFEENPKPFCMLAKELFPGQYQPTPTHHFIRMLEEKGVLLRCFTQNIDGLERIAGVSSDLIMEAHGSFATSHCIKCNRKHPTEWVKDVLFADEIPRCKNTKCNGLVKPDIVFFGEGLPDRFEELVYKDFPKADCLIVMGTSLKVRPFNTLIDRVSANAPRLLINREAVGLASSSSSYFDRGFLFDNPQRNYRDVFCAGNCDDGVMKLAEAAGWDDRLNQMIRKSREEFKQKSVSASSPSQAVSQSTVAAAAAAASSSSASASASSASAEAGSSCSMS